MAEIMQSANLRGVIKADGNLIGKAHILNGTGDAYGGEYVVTPSIVEQTLPTRNKTLAGDVTVEAIPYYEVSNDTGNTFIIGG